MKRTTSRASGAAVAVLASLFVLISTAGLAQIPQTISYQGSLSDSGGAPVTGAVAMTFSLYDAAVAGTLLWQETQPAVSVTNGAFSAVFGTNAGNPLDVSLFAGQLYLGIAVGADAEMTPRQALTAVGYAIQAKNAETLGGLLSSEIIAAAADEVRTPITTLPFTISIPGSYYLTGNLSLADTAANGITVNNENVTIDLMGFSIVGPGSGTGNGIFALGANNVEVRNGMVRGFGVRGVAILTSPGRANNRVIAVTATSNGLDGIFVMGHNVLVKNCTAAGNGGIGIAAGQGYYGARVIGNNGYANAGPGISVGNAATVAGNNTRANDLNGIQVGQGSTVSGNVADGNTADGIVASIGSTVAGNTASNNGQRGISADQGATVSGNTVYRNGTQGISVLAGATVRANTAYFNQDHGILLFGESLVEGNTAYNNNQSGGGFPNMSPCATCTFGTNHAP